MGLAACISMAVLPDKGGAGTGGATAVWQHNFRTGPPPAALPAIKLPASSGFKSLVPALPVGVVWSKLQLGDEAQCVTWNASSGGWVNDTSAAWRGSGDARPDAAAAQASLGRARPRPACVLRCGAAAATGARRPPPQRLHLLSYCQPPAPTPTPPFRTPPTSSASWAPMRCPSLLKPWPAATRGRRWPGWAQRCWGPTGAPRPPATRRAMRPSASCTRRLSTRPTCWTLSSRWGARLAADRLQLCAAPKPAVCARAWLCGVPSVGVQSSLLLRRRPPPASAPQHRARIHQRHGCAGTGGLPDPGGP